MLHKLTSWQGGKRGKVGEFDIAAGEVGEIKKKSEKLWFARGVLLQLCYSQSKNNPSTVK